MLNSRENTTYGWGGDYCWGASRLAKRNLHAISVGTLTGRGKGTISDGNHKEKGCMSSLPVLPGEQCVSDP